MPRLKVTSSFRFAPFARGAAAAAVALIATAACGENVTGPDAVATLDVTPSSATLNAVGATQRFTAEALTSSGKMVREISFRWESVEPGVATVDGSGTATAEGNGTTRIRVTVVGSSMSASATLTVDQEVASVDVTPDSARIESLGGTVDFDAVLDDVNGNPVEDAQPTWSSRDTDVATVDSDGTAEARGNGSTHVVAEADGVRDSARLVVEDTGGDGGEANLVASSFALKPRGVLESGTVRAEGTIRNAGDAASGPFRWEIRSGGSALASGEVSDLGPGSSVSIPTQSGLGPFAAGTHALRFEVDAGEAVEESDETDNSEEARLESYPPGYDIELQFVGTLSDETKQVVRDARDQWAELVTGDLPDITPSDTIDLDRCFDGSPGAGERTETIDDVLMLVRQDSIDGEGDTAAQAGPCFIRVNSTDPEVPPHPVVGRVVLDSADIGRLRNNGIFDDVVLHEVGHVLGFGGLWDQQGGDGEGPFQLLEEAGPEDPIFVGALAVEEFLEAGGDAYDGEPVPVANEGGEGTRGSHWRESVFDNELMTGFINTFGPNPLSAVTVGSLADMFYAVDLGEADSFQISLSAAAAATGSGVELGDHVFGPPPFGLDPAGRVYRLRAEEPK